MPAPGSLCRLPTMGWQHLQGLDSRPAAGDWLNYTDGLAEKRELRMSVLVEGARRLGIELSTGQLAQLDQLGAALRDGNQRVNLTRITDPAEIETRHFL